MKTAVLIPTFNEAETIGDLVDSLADNFVVFVVDDNSQDGTAEIAEKCGALVIRNTTRKGLAKSLLQGFEMILDFDYFDSVVTIDAGGSHSYQDAHNLNELLQFNDLVIGSRFVKGAYYDNLNGKFYRPFLSRLAAKLLNLAQHRVGIKDWTSGFRAYRIDLLKALMNKSYFSTMHPIQIELLGRANELGAKVFEYPITYVAGRSQFKMSTVNEAITVWLQVLNHYSAKPKEVIKDSLW